MRLVVDASALAAYLLSRTLHLQLAQILEEPSADLHVPALCDIEISSVLRSSLPSRAIDERRAAEVTANDLDLPLSRHGHERLLGRILELRKNFSSHDATYVALTEQLRAALLTGDAKLARAVRCHLDLAVLP